MSTPQCFRKKDIRWGILATDFGVTSKPVTLGKWANIIAKGESLPGCVNLGGEKGSDGRRRLSHHGGGGRRGWGGRRRGREGSRGPGLACRPGGRLWSPALWWSSFFSCYAPEKKEKEREMDAFELHGSYRNGWSSSTLALGRQRPAGPSWRGSIIRGRRVQDTHWHICWHRVYKQGPVERVCRACLFFGG